MRFHPPPPVRARRFTAHGAKIVWYDLTVREQQKGPFENGPSTPTFDRSNSRDGRI